MKKVILLFWLLLSMQLLGMEVNGNYSNFLYYESAMKSGSEVRITPDEGGKKGAVWSRNVFDLNEDFHFEYEIYLGTKGIESYESLKKENPYLNMEDKYIDANGNVDIGADGMAFTFKSSDYKNDNYGNAGQNIGYGGGNFPYSFGVKFDTYTNPYYDPQSSYENGRWVMGNITKDHIAFIARGKIGTTRDSGVDGGTTFKEIDEMEDGEWHKVTFDWDASNKRFTYTFRDGMKTYTDTYSGDIVKEYLGGKYAYFGFTSSTGQWMNEHKLRNVRVKGTIPTDDYKLDIKKEVVSGNNYKLGDTIKYRITIINPGSETLTDIKLKDGKDISDNDLASDVTLERSTWPELKAGEKLITYGTKKVTQADIDEGSVIRTAAVEARKRDGEKLYAAAEAVVYPSIVEGLEVSKTIVGDNSYTKVGESITYNFRVTNTGTITLTDLSVLDLKIPGVILNKVELAPGETATGSGNYTVTQEDIDHGSIENTANFRAVKPDGSVIGGSSTAIATGVLTSSIEVHKTVTTAGEYKFSKVGDKITYSFTVKNTGNTTLTAVTVTDPKISAPITLDKATLLPGDTATGTGEYTVTQQDVDAGKVDNTATFTGTDPNNGKVTEKDTVSAKGQVTADFTVTNTPVINDKDSSSVVNKYTKVGDIVTYTLTLKNTGNATLKDIVVTDTNNTTGITMNKDTLLPGDTATGTVTHKVTQADIDAGTIVNPANFTAKDSKDVALPKKEATATVNGDTAASIEVHKTITTAGEYKFSKVGDKITYSFTVKNTGNTTLTAVTVTDPKISAPITLDKATLLPGDTATGTGEYTVTQQDVDAGKVDNTATFTGTDPNNGKVTEKDTVSAKGQVTADFTVTNTPVINDKDSSSVVNKYTKVGDIVTYTLTLKNTGNATLKDIVVTDTNNTTGITMNKDTLLPGDTATGTVTHKVTQADIDAGTIVNPANFTAKDSKDAALPAKEATATVNGETASSIEVHKTVTTAEEYKFSKVGDKITYSFTVKNTGNTTLTNVTVTDPKITAPITLDKATLLPGDTATGTGEYTVTQEDVDAGKVDNTATFTGTDPNNCKVTEKDTVSAKGQVTADFTVTNTPVINDKDSSSMVNKYTKVGDIVTYTLTLKNTGNATLKDIVVTDTNNTTGITMDKDTLFPGDTATGTVTHKVTQADIDAGTIVNPANFTAKDSKDVALPKKEATATVNGDTAASIEVHKTITTAGEYKFSKVGDKITYSFTVKNTGNTTLTAVTVTDPKISAPITLDKATLLPGDTATGTGEYTVTQQDVDAGKVDNTATFTGTDPNNGKVTEKDTVSAKGQVTADFTVTNTPVINDKDSSSVVNKYTKVGDIVTYTLTLKNTGNATLKDIVVTDTNNTTGITMNKDTLLPGDTATGTVTHKVTQADIDAGTIVNPANFTAKDSKDAALPAKEATATVNGETASSIEVHKTVTTAEEYKFSKVGDKITYSFTVKNTGNTTLTNVTVTDPKITAPITLDKATLLPGDTATGTGEYTVTQEDVDAGKVDNTATFTGTDPNNCKVTEKDTVSAKGQVTADFTVTNTPVINDKDSSSMVNKYTKVGDIVTYTLTLKNTGNATLKDIVVTDTNNTTGITMDKDTLFPGDTATGTVTHKVTQADIDAGTIVNPANFTAKDSKDAALPAKEATATVNGKAIVDLSIEKAVTDESGDGKAQDREMLTYTIIVKNNSNITITNPNLTDTLSSKFFNGQTPKNLEVKGASIQGSLKNGITLDKIAVGHSVKVTFQMKAIYPAGTISGDRVDNIATLTYDGKSVDSKKVSLPVEELSLVDLDIKLDVKDLGGKGTKRGDGVVEDGESAEYTISVTNNSSVDAENVRVIDPYKELFLYKDNSYSYLSLEDGITSAKDLGEGIVIPRVKAGETIKLKFQVEFAYKGREVYEGDTIPNQAYLSFDQNQAPRRRSLFQISSFAATPDQKKDSNVVVLNVAEPSYTLTKTIRGKQTTFYPGDTVVYDIQLTNNSTVIGRDVKIQDRVSQIKAFESWDWRREEVKDTESLLKTEIRRDLFETGLTINPGETKNYTLVGKLKSDLKKGDVTNTAEAGKNLEIKAEATLKVEEADIKIEKIVKKRWVSIGDLVSYKIIIQNLSASESSVLRDVRVVDILPPGFKYAENSGKIDGKKVQVENKGRTVYFKGLTLTGKKELEINYILRVGTGVKPGTYVNKAWAENSPNRKASKIAEAKVEVINDPLFNSTVIIGKVFHDRDGDGWQDDATAKRIKVKTLTNQANYSGGFMEKGGERWSISQDDNEIILGDLNGKISEDSTANTIMLKRGIINPKISGDIVVSTKEGTTITLKGSGEVIKSYKGSVKKGLSGEEIAVSRKIVKNPSYREGFKDVKGKKRVVLNNIFAPVYFDSAYALIKENESEKLKKYIENLQHKKNLKIILTGYTDSQHLTKRAKKRYRNNLHLSLARAEVLKEYLAAKLDITEDMFVVEGRGSENPVASNWTSSGRELNRRTEISIEYDEEITEKKLYKIDNSSYFEVIEIRNEGVKEEGIPGVRLATVEGLVMETDRFGRFHVDGVDDIPDRGKNYIIKVDKATLPPDTLFTTENPRVKTLSKVMEKFNFGVKMPEMKKINKEKIVEIRVGSVFFKTNKWEIKEDQFKNLNSIADLLKKHNGGTIIVEGNADSRASNEYNRVLALKRAKTVEEELTKLLGEKEVSKVTIISQLPGGEM